MSDNKDVDVTKEWRATQGQKSAASRLRIFAAIAWVIAIGTEIAGVVMLRQHKFDHGNLPLLIGLLVVIAIFAIGDRKSTRLNSRHPSISYAVFCLKKKKKNKTNKIET